MEDGETEGVEKVRDILRDNSHSLKISRVHPEIKRRFKKLAAEEFMDDYGMLLKFLMDGLINRDVAELHERLNVVEEQIAELLLKDKKEEPQERVIRMCDGTVRRLKRGNGGKEK